MPGSPGARASGLDRRAFRAALAAEGRADELDDLLRADNEPPRVSLVALPGARRRSPNWASPAPSRRSPRGRSGAIRPAMPSSRPDGPACRTRARSSRRSRSAGLARSSRASAGSTCAPARAARQRCSRPRRPSGAPFCSPTSSFRPARDWCATPWPSFAEPPEVVEGDGRRFAADARRFDRILLDAPCTGLGALRRRPEARWRKQPSDLAELTALQAELLDAAIDALRRAACWPTSPARRTSPRRGRSSPTRWRGIRSSPSSTPPPCWRGSRLATSTSGRRATCSSGRTGTAPTPCSSSS